MKYTVIETTNDPTWKRIGSHGPRWKICSKYIENKIDNLLNIKKILNIK